MLLQVAVCKSELYEFYVLPPTEALESSHTSVAYRMVKSHNVYNNPNLYEASELFLCFIYLRDILYSLWTSEFFLLL